MFRRGVDMVLVELFQMRHRVSTWVLFALWGTAALFFNYVLPYLVDDVGSSSGRNTSAFGLLMPDQFVNVMSGGFPFYGGAIALILGVLTVGSEFGWGTWKTLFTQRPGRVQVFSAKMAAIGIILVPFSLLVFAVGAAASSFVAWREGVAMDWPGASSVVEAMLAGWVILAVWAAVGVLLAVVTRGTSLAIGLGLLYTLVIEGLLSAFANQISWLEPIANIFVRANAYSLVRALGSVSGADAEGPGAFAGPFVSGSQALVVMIAYVVVFLGVSAWLLDRRDVV